MAESKVQISLAAQLGGHVAVLVAACRRRSCLTTMATKTKSSSRAGDKVFLRATVKGVNFDG